MELKQELGAVARRWPIVLAVTLFSLVVAGYFTLHGPRAYEATLSAAVSVSDDQPQSATADAPPFSYYRDYYLWLSSDYLADDLVDLIQSDAFGTDVANELHEDPRVLALPSVVKALKTNRILEVTVQAPSQARALELATTMANLLQTDGPKYISELSAYGGQVTVIDMPSAHPATTTGSQVDDLALRGLLGLFAGLFLAFVVDYVDSTLKSAGDVRRALGLSILGEIPIEPRYH